MDEQDVKSLAVKLAAVTDRIEKRLDGVARETMRASQAMGVQAQQSLAASEVRASEIRLEGAAERLEQRMLSVGKLQAAGRLGLCPRDGDHVCAKVDKRWVRLDP